MMNRVNRPSAVLVIAILQIVFGVLGLLGRVYSGGVLLAGAPQQPELEVLLRQWVPHHEKILYGGIVLGLISCAVMIVSGTGLLGMRRWARPLTIGYVFYNIAITVAGVVYAFVVTGPAMRVILAQMRSDATPSQQSLADLKLAETMVAVGPFLQLVFLVYPLALLIVLFLPDVRAAFDSCAKRRKTS
jgi:hypothetical protein